MGDRGYQTTCAQNSYAAWNTPNVKVVMPVLPTGGGKTKVMGRVANDFDAPGIAIAHRQELTGQISIALAREGIKHDLLVSDSVRRMIVKEHIEKLGRNFVTNNSRWHVAGVDTMARARPIDMPWLPGKRMAFIDEGHHVLKHNKWGRAFSMLTPGSFGFFPTATPRRADGAGLGSQYDGLVDHMEVGPGMRQLIDSGYLTDYKLYGPTVEDLDLSHVEISDATGDYNKDALRKAIHASSKIVGDVVRHYLEIAPGKLGVTFAVDVEEAVKIAAEFRRCGVPAEVVSAKTSDDLRRSILRRFANREILQLVNVDLFGEGFDLPAIEVVSFARPTASFALYCQQFGRVLRLMLGAGLMDVWESLTIPQRLAHIAASTKPWGIIIDHVGNILAHGLPDALNIQWSLARREKRARNMVNDSIPLRYCMELSCLQPYERIKSYCPFCGTAAPAPAVRGGPELVDGNLYAYSDEVLRTMRGAVAKVEGSATYHPNSMIMSQNVARHNERYSAQLRLRKWLDLWAGAHPRDALEESYRRFFLTFNIDLLGAIALNKEDAIALTDKIIAKLARDGFDTISHLAQEL